MRWLALLLFLPSCHLRDHYAAWRIERELSEPWFSSAMVKGHLDL